MATDPTEDAMVAPDRTAPPPLIRGGSNVFGAIAVTALLLGGLAGIVGGGDDTPEANALSARASASAADHHADDHADAAGHRLDDAHALAATGAPSGHGHAGASAATTAGPPGAGSTVGHGHDDVVAGETDQASAGRGDHDHGDAAPAGADHGGHGGDTIEGGAHHHAGGCADDHPTTMALVSEVQGELATTYKDVLALIALGYHPYFDSLVPGGYPPGGEGISHWINPNYIDDGVVLDPQRPETILLDDWYWPIGMMFINDPGVAPVPVYVNGDGTACSPWHPHTDAPARFGWYYYRAVYDREIEGEVPAQTPEMMHVWAVPNPAGVYAAHEYPPREVRQGPPGPLPSFFSETEVPD